MTDWMYFRTQAAPFSIRAAGVPKVLKSWLSTGSLMGARVYDCGDPEV